MSETVQATNGQAIPVNDLAQEFTRDADGNVESITVVYQAITYVQTFTYTDGAVTDISQWTAQP